MSLRGRMTKQTNKARKRAGALIIRDKKLLLVGDGTQPFYWIPGGGVEGGETYEEALDREIFEELGCQVKSAKLFTKYHLDYQEITSGIYNPETEIENYLVEIDGEIKLDAEIKEIIWASKEELGRIQIPNTFRENTLVKLISESLL